MKKIITATAAAVLLAASVHATIAPRYDVTIDASKSVTSQKQRLEMAQAGNQDFGFTFSNLQGSLATNDAVRWYYTAADLSWQVAVTGSVEDADTALVQVSPAYSNTNTLNDGAFPWRLEVQDAEDGTILATACGSLIIPQNPLAPGQPALVTTTNINTADYTVTGQWPASSIPDLSGSYETAATNDPGSAGYVLTTDGNGTNYWSQAGAGDITGVAVSGGLLTGGGTSGDVTVGLTTGAVNAAESDPIWGAVSNTVTTGAAAGATAVQPATLNAHTNLTLASGAHGGELDPAWSATDLAANNGGSLTNLNADNLASGTVPDARIGSDIARDAEVAATYLPLDGSKPMGANLNMGGNNISNVVQIYAATTNGMRINGGPTSASTAMIIEKDAASIGRGAGVTLRVDEITEIVSVSGGSFSLSSGATVDTIETTLTDDDTHIPTSGAVIDYGNANWSGVGAGGYRALATPYDFVFPTAVSKVLTNGFTVIEWDQSNDEASYDLSFKLAPTETNMTLYSTFNVSGSGGVVYGVNSEKWTNTVAAANTPQEFTNTFTVTRDSWGRVDIAVKFYGADAAQTATDVITQDLLLEVSK